MADHRVRLSDEDIALIVSALKARSAMTRDLRRHRVHRLIVRLSECGRGNPKFMFGVYEQSHEEDLEDGCEE
jgi:hypothetical protein